MDDRDKGFTQAVSWAVWWLNGFHEEQTAYYLLKESGIPLKDFIEAQVEPYEIKVIKKLIKNK